MVECCGKRCPAEADLLQRVMTEQGVPLERQLGMWIDFLHQLPDPRWAALCLDRAEALHELLDRQRRLLATTGVNSASNPTALPMPLSPLAPRHFVWLGEGRGVLADQLRGGIAALARRGIIANDTSQQDALRRGLGLMLNDHERSSPQPWVRWLASSDMLNYLIENLWRQGLIYCVEGQRAKWQTLCGVFLRADGSPFQPSIKSNRCKNPLKTREIDTAFLNGLAPMGRLK